MKFISTILFICLGILQSHGQATKTYKVNPGQKVMQAIPAEAMYSYPEFRFGQVQFRNGRIGGARMSYNALLEEMEFINDKGDTSALDDLNAVQYIAFDKDTFYYEKGYLRQIANNGELKLLEKKVLDLSNRQKIGGFGELNGGSVDVIDKMSTASNPLRTLVAQEVLTFSENFSYYFADHFNHFRQANRKNLMDMFGRKYPGLDGYLEKVKPNYFSGEDMQELMNFLSGKIGY